MRYAYFSHRQAVKSQIMLASIVRMGLIGLVKLLVGAQARWVNAAPNNEQSIYFTNHSSHLDTWALWAALPAKIRLKARPVAAKDYWGSGIIKRFIALYCALLRLKC